MKVGAIVRSPCLTFVGAALLLLTLAGCYDLKLDTVPEWCDQIAGTNLEEKYRPFWAVFFVVSIHADAIRDDYVAMLDKIHMEKVVNRSPRVAWREGTALHLVNLSTLMVIEPDEIISGWRDGIAKAKTHDHTDEVEACLYGTVVSLFDDMRIHSIELDQLGRDREDKITIIDTERAARASKAGRKPL